MTNQTEAIAAPDTFESRWRLGLPGSLALGIVILLVAIVFRDGISTLIGQWSRREEYSHAYLIPLISLFLIWQKKNELSAIEWTGSVAGVVLCAAGILLFAAGSLSTLYVVIQYALVLTIAGAVIGTTGVKSGRYLWVPLVYLLFMIPLPNFLYQALSIRLQLISSELGVAMIRQLGISVFLEGNVIDLGSYKLQVVEACNGLRYLFPLMSFGFLCAYLYRGPFWHKALLLVSTVPITVLMNSFRIGLIGYTVDRWGQEMADGILHDFEGWAVFMACLAILFAEMWVLSRLQRPARPLSDTFYLEMPVSKPMDGAPPRSLPRHFYAVLAVLGIGVVLSLHIVEREEIVPSRTDFAVFPLEIDGWQGRRGTIEDTYLDVLKLTDYVMVDYVRDQSEAPVNLYVAYYDSQRAGASAHSPRTCIPGGGWKIEDHRVVDLDVGRGATYPVNRVEIALGSNRQLVYYWFRQRGRIISSEWMVKWYLFWDSLTRNRSDGALVRVTTPILPTETWTDGDARLNEFSKSLGNTLEPYVPD